MRPLYSGSTLAVLHPVADLHDDRNRGPSRGIEARRDDATGRQLVGTASRGVADAHAGAVLARWPGHRRVGTRRTRFALLALLARWALGSGRPRHRRVRPGWPRRPGHRRVGTGRSLKPLRPAVADGSERTLGADVAAHSLRSRWTLHAGRTDETTLALRTVRAGRAVWPRWPADAAFHLEPARGHVADADENPDVAVGLVDHRPADDQLQLGCGRAWAVPADRDDAGVGELVGRAQVAELHDDHRRGPRQTTRARCAVASRWADRAGLDLHVGRVTAGQGDDELLARLDLGHATPATARCCGVTRAVTPTLPRSTVRPSPAAGSRPITSKGNQRPEPSCAMSEPRR